MAMFNEILAGRFNRFAQKHFSMKGREGTPTLAADVALNLNFHGGAENLYLEAWDLFAINFICSASAGNLSTSFFRNPPGSGVVCVLMRVAAIETSATNTAFASALTFGITKNSLVDQASTGLNANVCGLDARARPGPTAHVTFNPGALTSFGGSTMTLATAMGPAFTYVEFLPPQIEIPVLPGTGFWIQAGVVNDAINSSWYWRERSLEDSEKT